MAWYWGDNTLTSWALWKGLSDPQESGSHTLRIIAQPSCFKGCTAISSNTSPERVSLKQTIQREKAGKELGRPLFQCSRSLLKRTFIFFCPLVVKGQYNSWLPPGLFCETKENRFPPCCGRGSILTPYFPHSRLDPSVFDPLVTKTQENKLSSWYRLRIGTLVKITGLLNSQRTDSLPPLFSQGPTGACICENLCYLFIEEQTIVLEFFLLVFYAQSKLKKKKKGF